MASDDLINVHKHGMGLDSLMTKVKCNYCDKVVGGFHRLKCHLGGIRGDVVPCLKVPNDVKEVFEIELREKKMKKLERDLMPDTGGVICNQTDARNNNRSEGSSLCEGDCLMEDGGLGTASFSKKTVFPEVLTNCTGDARENELKKSLGKWLFGSGLYFRLIENSDFQEMISSFYGHGQLKNNIPSCQELKEWILQDSLERMQQHVKDMKHSWKSTGCSILLDGWTDSEDRNLVNILVSCPKGVVFLKSSDISTFIGDVDAMRLFLEEVLQEVGIENVIQIITYSTSEFMELVGKQIMEKHKHLFWTASTSYCIELVLEKFGALPWIEVVLGKARLIIEFIKNHATALARLRASDCLHKIAKLSEIRLIGPYLALENIISNKQSLKRMFASPDWKATEMSTSTEGKKVADLVRHSLLWKEAIVAVKASIPLINALRMLYENNKMQTGDLLKMIYQAKETIKEGLEHKESLYIPFWILINEIWENHVHIPLHSAACFLNPIHFDTSSSDPDIASDTHDCIARMEEDPHVQNLIWLQSQNYIKGTFNRNAICTEPSFAPELWWSRHGGEYPELQRLAVRILSQTCDGASKFNLRRNLPESWDDKYVEFESHLTFIHYNMLLQNFVSGKWEGSFIEHFDPKSSCNYNIGQFS